MQGFKGATWQIGTGLWLSLAVALGILSRSWASFGGILSLGVFIMVGFLTIGAVTSKSKALRILGIVGSTAYGLVFIGAMLSTAERIYLVNADSYPRFLAQDLNTADQQTINGLRENECKSAIVEVFEKENHRWILRCGFFWFDGHTYISNTDPFSELKKERAR